MYLDGELMVHEIVTFERDAAVRDTIVGQDEFMVGEEGKGETEAGLIRRKWKGWEQRERENERIDTQRKGRDESEEVKMGMERETTGGRMKPR